MVSRVKRNLMACFNAAAGALLNTPAGDAARFYEENDVPGAPKMDKKAKRKIKRKIKLDDAKCDAKKAKVQKAVYASSLPR